MSTFLHYVHFKDALLDCSAPGGERCESLTWVDEIDKKPSVLLCYRLCLQEIVRISCHINEFDLRLLMAWCHEWSDFRMTLIMFGYIIFRLLCAGGLMPIGHKIICAVYAWSIINKDKSVLLWVSHGYILKDWCFLAMAWAFLNLYESLSDSCFWSIESAFPASDCLGATASLSPTAAAALSCLVQ